MDKDVYTRPWKNPLLYCAYSLDFCFPCLLLVRLEWVFGLYGGCKMAKL